MNVGYLYFKKITTDVSVIQMNKFYMKIMYINLKKNPCFCRDYLSRTCVNCK